METSFAWNLTLFSLINAPERANDTVVMMAKLLAVFSPWLVIGVLVLCWLFGTAEVRRALMIAGVALGLGMAVNFSIAFLLYVPRPFELGIGNSLLSHALETSFPSDHATFLWSLGLGLLATRPLRLLGGVVVCLGLAVAWARVYLGVHFPLDMIVSLIISLLVAAIAGTMAGKLDRVLFRPVERINAILSSLVIQQKDLRQ